MSLPALKIFPDSKESGKKLKERIIDTHTEELIIGLCGPIGTDIHFVAKQLGSVIDVHYGYKFEIIRLSDFIKKLFNVKREDFTSEYDYVNQLIAQGNELRKEKGPSVLAELAINEIAVKREITKQEKSENTFKSERTCYIIDSLKNVEELELFRLIYSDLFYFIGVFSNIEIRVQNLENRRLQKHEVYKLIDVDSGEEIQFGQKVANTFVQADFFLRLESSNSVLVNSRIIRYLNLIFNSEIITPSSSETAMYQAFAAAGNSACLSRQVGASITNDRGDIISVGWNDVPKYNGGVYTYSETNHMGGKDHRCLYVEGGKCFNDSEKQLIQSLLLDKLIQEGVINLEDKVKADSIIRSSRIKELIEFSRAVHAEMHAIIVGSQKSGADVVGGKLFCTTYPCHNCARHIIAAGIKDVYYIEPYRKSLALKLHQDSITEIESQTDKVRILMFDGVSPRRYLEFFTMSPNSRKENGIVKNIDKKKAFPKHTVSLQAIPILEKEIIKELESKELIKIDGQ
ncbi:anti-phage dCTP deaminase [Pontibacter burrus]|uniref:Deoxycytidylate deaminase n=1 Tax=Pontibacter burrus TaxID=2704466 RepID=A0A6B3LZN9_9BACT|nr:anti-phage dCTP deaminase [Pontibacter burrus]NEM99138.1 deoxycytidylate deaminase [Pontibacter burrus]